MKIEFTKNGSIVTNTAEIESIKFTTEEKVIIGVLVGAAAFMGGFVFASITKMAVKSVLDGYHLDIRFPQVPHGALLTPLTEAGEALVEEAIKAIV